MTFHGLAPAMLLAAPRLGDPNFERTVVVLGKHEPGGALGWVVNGTPVAPVAELLQASGLVPPGVVLPTTPSFRATARLGGPVAPQSGWVLYRSGGGPVASAIDMGAGLAATGDPEALGVLMRGGPPREFRLLLGYAGWGPGQLENEMRAGVWLPTSVDPALVFAESREEVWDKAYRAATGASAGMFGGQNWGSA